MPWAIALRRKGLPLGERTYRAIVRILRREYGVFTLESADDELTELRGFFLSTPESEKALDVIELTFKAIDRVTRTIHYKGEKTPRRLRMERSKR